MPSIQETVRRARAVVFDLFHTLTAIESSWGQGLPFTYEMLGVDRDAWDKQLNRYSRTRLAGEEQDSTRIVGRMAREINPDITDDTIQSAGSNCIRRFEAALLDIPVETRTVLQTLKSQKKKLGLISNADTMEVAAWDRSPIAGIFDVDDTLFDRALAQRKVLQIIVERYSCRNPAFSVVINNARDQPYNTPLSALHK